MESSLESSLFPGFEARRVDAGEAAIFIRRKGSGPPLLLLHGFPETHLMWHRIAPELARDFTVICADLRGYGASDKPASAPDHGPFGKTAMARDMVAVMERLGFARFSVAGHDRGGRVAYRLALDHPERVQRVALLDIIPTGEAFARADARFALGFWPWSLLAQPEPLPERLILADPAAVIDDALTGWGSQGSHFPAEVRAAYVDALRDPAGVHAICEEYRAAVTLDRVRDDADRAAAGSSLHRCWHCGAPAVRSTRGTRTRAGHSGSGAGGDATCAAARSRAGTSFPRRTPSRR
jgi:haloacetate dehalogenase